MKTSANTSVSILISFVIGLSARGQLNNLAALSDVSSVSPDSIVKLTAEAQGLNLVPSGALPKTGTFWMVMPGANGGVMAPMPCPPGDLTLPTYAIADGQFLVDGTGGQISLSPRQTAQGMTLNSALEAQANSVLNLIDWIQGSQLRQLARAMNLPTPYDGDGGGVYGPTSDSSSFPANTNFLISVQGGNIALDWRSTTNRLFLLEDRPTLTSESQWNELANYYLSAANTNWTKLVHTNIINLQPMNFYRIFDVTPVAHEDFFTVDQDSTANQLDIFQNDFCLNDDPIYIANLVTAQHGEISYSSDATTFQYTPNAGFYGVDFLSYAITSGHGEISSNATATIFVNQSGNSSPVVPDLLITLPTNVYAASFNALTNANDPDGDTNILFAVNAPSLGSVSNDASGNITYIRNPGLFGSDAFTYIITDGKGGYGLGHVKVLQVDTDGDGMPDQWEMANGLDPFTDDSMADPDNDGLPNLAEFVLRTNPQVADNPLNLSAVTNGMPISGFAQIPIRGLSPSISTPPLSLCVNSNLAEQAFISQGPDGQWLVNWDTTFLANGSYQIQLVCPIAPPSSPDSIANILGESKTVEVFNPIRFDSFTSKFTSFLLIYGTLAVTNSTFDIYLNDENGNPLVYATGLSAPDGQIALYWDLTDGNGNQISFGDIQAEFDIYPPASNANGPQPNTPSNPTQVNHRFHKDAGSINKNTFSIAWGWDWYSGNLTDSRIQLMENGVINILGNPAENSYSLFPAGNIPYADMAFRYDTDSDKSILLHALNVSGNFFWFGHGGFNTFFGNPLHSAIGESDVSQLLGNFAYKSSPKHPKRNNHPYFLTILNACQTSSIDWAGAFGVDFADHNSYVDYVNAGRPPRAFVGWASYIRVPSSSDIGMIQHSQYAEALAYMFNDWMSGYPLNYCLGDFSNHAIAAFPSFTGADTWTISGCYDLERGD